MHSERDMVTPEEARDFSRSFPKRDIEAPESNIIPFPTLPMEIEETSKEEIPSLSIIPSTESVPVFNDFQDETLKSNPTLPEINIGKKATVSYVIREGFNALLGRKSKDQDTTEISASPDEDIRMEEVRSLVSLLESVQGHAEMIAHRQARHETADETYVSPLEQELALKDMIDFKKSQAMVGLFQLMEIDKMPEEKKQEVMEHYRIMWGELSEDYENVYKQIKSNADENVAADEDKKVTRDAAAGILSDLNIPVERKIELLTRAGFTKKEAGKAVLFTAAAAVSTIGISAIAEGGAVASALSATGAPHLEGLQYPKDMETLVTNLKVLGIDAAMLGGFYATTGVYAKLHAVMTEKTGIGMNAFATGIHYMDKALGVSKDEIRKDMVKTIFIVNLMLDAPYLATIAIPEVGTSMMANAYKFGIELTAAQAAVCASIIGGAKAMEIIKAKRQAHQERLQTAKPKPTLSTETSTIA